MACAEAIERAKMSICSWGKFGFVSENLEACIVPQLDRYMTNGR